MANFNIENELFENPTTRVPVCLCLDTSSSMSGTPIALLNEGIRMFLNEVLEDEIAKYSVELAIVTFDSNVTVIQDFATAESVNPATLYANGCTSTGSGVNMALNLLENRKREYQNAGVGYYQPWLVVMTDGEPTESDYEVQKAAQRTRDLVENRKLTQFLIAIGDHANTRKLGEFSPKGESGVLTLNGLKFKDFFQWLSQSVSVVSQSTPGDRIKLPAPKEDLFTIDV